MTEGIASVRGLPRAFRLCALACALLLLVIAPVRSLHAEQPSDAMQKSVYYIQVKGVGSGTGFIVAPGILATNAHVVVNAPQGDDAILVAPPLGRRDAALRARVIWIDVDGDMALLAVDGLAGEVLTLGLAPVKKGAHVYAIGYPGVSNEWQQKNDSIDSTLTDGRIQNIYAMPWGRKVNIFQHGAEITHGNSGGPLFDGCGRVIGINSAGPLVPVGMFLALNINELKSAAEQARVPATFKVSDQVCGPDEKLVEPPAAKTPAPSTPVARPSGDTPPPGPKYPLWTYIAGGMGAALVLGIGFVFAVMRGSKANAEAGGDEQPEVRPSTNPNTGPSFALTGEGRTIELHSALTGRPLGMTIGRVGAFVDAVIGGDEVSRRHARFAATGHGLAIEDLNSAAGTLVNGERLVPFTPRALRVGDQVTFGKRGYRLAMQTTPPAASPPKGGYQTFLIGRHSDCDLEIRGDPTVGRRHAELTIASDGRALLTDRQSRAGSRVKRDGKWEALTSLALTPDMQLKFGNVETRASSLMALAQNQPSLSPPAPLEGGSGIVRRNPQTGEIIRG